MPALVADHQAGLAWPQIDQGGVIETAILVSERDHGGMLQGAQLLEACLSLLAAQTGASGVVTGGIERFRFIAPDPIEILHGALGVEGLIDGLGQLILLFGGLVNGDRHLDLDHRPFGEYAEKLPAPPACCYQQGASQCHHQTGKPASLITDAAHLERRLADVAMDNLVAATGEGCEQGAIADEVDQARNAAGEPMQRLDRSGGKNGLHTTGYLQPEADVGIHIGGGEGQQVVAGGDALGQLAQQGQAQHLLQFGLADQHDLQ